LTLPAAVVTAGALTFTTRGAEPASPPAPGAMAAPAESLPAPLATTSYADAVEHVLPAVVTVQVQKRGETARFFGPMRPDPDVPAPLERGLGSGVIMTADGTILTNHHVVDGAEFLTVTLHDGRQFTGEVVGTDAPTDLAVIRIDAADLPTLPVADSEQVRVGDVVLAVGNPLGIGQTVTMGIISATGRQTGLGGDGTYQDFLQTDAPINRGNSGGALITTTGQLVGINSQIMSPSGGSIGIGFAIPTNMARHVMDQLVETGRVRRGLLGVTVQPITSTLAESLGLSRVGGAIVSSITEDGAADRAGLEPGDVILRVDGHQIDDSNDLRNRISSRAPGTEVTLDVVRDGRERRLRATLAELEAEAETAGSRPAGHGELGMTLERLTPELARRLRLSGDREGVVVTGVDPASAAGRAGLTQGDVIRDVDGTAVRTPADVREALSAAGDRPALLRIERAGQPLFLALPNR
jgi:Do/DeqQ family serine protease